MASEENDDSAESARRRQKMDDACDALVAAQGEMTQDCNAFEAILDDPARTSGQVEKAQHAVRSAAMKTMRRIAIAPPLPMIVAAAAGATRPAETCWALRAYGYVGPPR